MFVIPTIYIKNKKCVRLTQGDPSTEVVYSNEPVFQAKFWEREGATAIHLIDLDGAFEGKTQNLDLIQRISEEVSCELQVGGGIRDNRVIRALRNRGIDKIIVGTASADNKKFIKNLCKTDPSSTIIAIDAYDGFVVKNGWLDHTEKRAVDLLKELEEFGVEEVIYTDISRDGTLSGPNLDSIETMLAVTDIPLVVSGGIASLEDVRKLKEMEFLGLKGVVIGKALYEKRFTLREAMKVAAS